MSATDQPWTPERVVDVELARELIREQFADVPAERVELFGSGWDNTAFLVDDEIVFRFPRRAIAVDLLRHEAAALPALAPLIPLGVPVPAWLAEPTQRFDWPFAGYRHLEGATASSLELDDEARAALARPLGEFLRALHKVPPSVVRLPGDDWERTDFKRRRDNVAKRLSDLVDAGLIDDDGPWLAPFDAEHPQATERPTPVHGDLYARHVLVSDEGAPVGVIDWGDVHLGDPAIDLSVCFSMLPASARPDFEDAYGPMDERMRHMARLRATFSALTITSFGHDSGDLELVREGRRAMDLVLQA